MRIREIFLSTVLMSFVFATTEAMPPITFFEESSPALANVRNVSAPREPSPLIGSDKLLGSAYYATLNILSTDNQCSEFFGGAGQAVEIFKGLIARAKKVYSPSPVGIQMSGATTNVFNSKTQKRYRLFDKVSINTHGPFYRKRVSNAEMAISRVGTFEPNTKEVRVLMLLHELGHLVKGPDGDWLLPNDGSSEIVSQHNSERIEEVCGDEIKGLRKSGRFGRSPQAESIQAGE